MSDLALRFAALPAHDRARLLAPWLGYSERFDLVARFQELSPRERRAILAELSVEDEVDAYRGRLAGWVDDVWRGSMSGADLSRAMRAMIRGEAQAVFLAGLDEGGIKDASEDDLDEADEATIEGWIAEQLEFVRGFATDAVKAADEGAPPTAQLGITHRIDAWGAAFRGLGGLGRASANRNQMVTWRLNGDHKTDAHCETCNWLHGKRQRLSWFTERNYRPGAPAAAMECWGKECGCSVVNDRGGQVLP